MALNLFGVGVAQIAIEVQHEGGIDADSRPDADRTLEMVNERAAQIAIALNRGQGIDAEDVLITGDTNVLYLQCRGKLKSVVGADWIAKNQRAHSAYTLEEIRQFEDWLKEVGTKDITEDAAGQSGIRHGFGSGGTRTKWLPGVAFE